ncbi:ATP-binding protein [Vibrio sp. Isolate31]|uniref:ATP-dependent nuclease n=1 Tax=Vibrio sp. Isolate31 TaxID=2908537 RepID=UPI001EFDEFB9|nr:ATP-binding protein [Vibrio sp. Isolate31]MCG9602236.1 ATP-binding protein [Vibrio sp. Isolate31]
MSTVVGLKVSHFRGIKELSLTFNHNRNLVCFIGRGDSGKTTILEAISLVLSPKWNINFSDTDFFGCDVSKEIVIEATIINFPDKLLTDAKFGLYTQAYNTNTSTIEEELPNNSSVDHYLPALTIRLSIDQSLEPTWNVVSNRSLEDRPISSKERALMDCYLISDYFDQHFSWNKGNPLNSVLRQDDNNSTDTTVIIEQLRKAKEEIDKTDFDNLRESTLRISRQAKQLGVNTSDIRTTLDSKELLIKDGRISLHDDLVPYRLKGKGSKRLLSMAIQSALVQKGGIMLVDEVEQGLEPDRAKQAVRALAEHNAGQIFLTTHSREVITELGKDPLMLLIKNPLNEAIDVRDLSPRLPNLQGAVRACPEAFFATKVIVCEGATEVGICRAIDNWRQSTGLPPLAFVDCAYVDGNGSMLATRVIEINDSGISTAIFCDSDLTTINKKKSNWLEKGISVFDCEEGLCIEQQIFTDMPWDGIKELLNYAGVEKVKSALSLTGTDPIKEIEENEESRQKIIALFKPRDGECGIKWFKQLHHGEEVGAILIKYINDLDPQSKIKAIFEGLYSWADEN